MRAPARSFRFLVFLLAVGLASASQAGELRLTLSYAGALAADGATRIDSLLDPLTGLPTVNLPGSYHQFDVFMELSNMELNENFQTLLFEVRFGEGVQPADFGGWAAENPMYERHGNSAMGSLFPHNFDAGVGSNDLYAIAVVANSAGAAALQPGESAPFKLGSAFVQWDGTASPENKLVGLGSSNVANAWSTFQSADAIAGVAQPNSTFIIDPSAQWNGPAINVPLPYAPPPVELPPPPAELPPLVVDPPPVDPLPPISPSPPTELPPPVALPPPIENDPPQEPDVPPLPPSDPWYTDPPAVDPPTMEEPVPGEDPPVGEESPLADHPFQHPDLFPSWNRPGYDPHLIDPIDWHLIDIDTTLPVAFPIYVGGFVDGQFVMAFDSDGTLGASMLVTAPTAAGTSWRTLQQNLVDAARFGLLGRPLFDNAQNAASLVGAPEPSSALLASLAFMVLAFARRHRAR